MRERQQIESYASVGITVCILAEKLFSLGAKFREYVSAKEFVIFFKCWCLFYIINAGIQSLSTTVTVYSLSIYTVQYRTVNVAVWYIVVIVAFSILFQIEVIPYSATDVAVQYLGKNIYSRLTCRYKYTCSQS